MPTLTIDNQSVTVPAGTSVLEAAKRLGIVIPHFCYHEALGAVGACRLCAMAFLEGPVKGVQMSCMVEAKDGMVVSTLDEKAASLRSRVIEWLMMNHPHDCPVCDEGGECQLQDMTIAGGHGIRRFDGLKRSYTNQDLGPFIAHEMNRCIQCYRCVRTYQDYCGGTDFGVMGSRQRVYFGRFRDGKLESPFSGNLVDVCPTGVLTDKTFRFKSRYWDLEEAPSICPHCSLGCAVVPGARYRELQRVRAGVNAETNGFFICDRGRFGYGHANHPDRPRAPRVDGSETDWPTVLGALRERLTRLAAEHGPQSVAFLGSPRASLEANALLKEWAGRFATTAVAFESHPERDRCARLVASQPPERLRSLADLRGSDFILVLGADPLAEGPLAALSIRQALRAGASAAIIDPRPVDLLGEAAHLPLAPAAIPAALRAIVDGRTDGFSRQQATVLAGIAARLAEAKRPILVGGADLLGSAGVADLLRAAADLDSDQRRCGAFVLLGGPNSFGAALLAEDGPDIDELLDAMNAGTVRALVCLEADPLADHPERGRVEQALGRLDCLAVLDGVPTPTGERAQILLPTTVPAETDGCFVNNEGRLQSFAAAFKPALPIRTTGNGDHPPRTFSLDTPGDRVRPAWAVLAELLERPAELTALRLELTAQTQALSAAAALEPGDGGRRVAPLQSAPQPTVRTESEPNDLGLYAVESFFGSELLASLSAPLDAVRPAPTILLHPADAARLGLGDGDQARLELAEGPVAVTVHLAKGLAEKIALVPRVRGTGLERLVPGSGPVAGRIVKGEAP